MCYLSVQPLTFFAGCVWVYRIYWPKTEAQFEESTDYCNREDDHLLSYSTYLLVTWCVVSRTPGRGVVETYVLCYG
jgi:hypothetical protein